MVWVSANPYQLGEFVAFQLDSVFKNSLHKNATSSLNEFLIDKDPFLNTDAYQNYELYRKEKFKLEQKLEQEQAFNSNDIDSFIALNQDSWEVYFIVGKYYFQNKFYTAALEMFEKALTKEITTVPKRNQIEENIKKIKRKLNDS